MIFPLGGGGGGGGGLPFGVDPNTLADGDILQYDAASGLWINLANGGTIDLANLDDVGIDTNTLVDKQLLQYDAATSSWVNVSVPLDDLSDVVITDVEEFQVLEYDGTNWVNKHASLTTWARNAESTTLNKGEVVYIFGGTGDHATVKRADKDTASTVDRVIGMVATAAAPNENCTVVTHGYVRGLNLSTGYAAGDKLWVGDDGGVTITRPAAPAHATFVGTVVQATVNGVVFVSIEQGDHLEYLHDVNIDSNTLTDGDVLTYDSSTSLWVNAPSAGGGGGGALVQSDFVDPYSYIGVAPTGSLTSDPVWNITRIEMDTGFPVTTASGVAWDDRLTETYI
jgi:hypothetical protein